MKSQPVVTSGVSIVGDIRRDALEELLERYELTVEYLADDAPISASFWGDSEAGIIGHQVYVRADTPRAFGPTRGMSYHLHDG